MDEQNLNTGTDSADRAHRASRNEEPEVQGHLMGEPEDRAHGSVDRAHGSVDRAHGSVDRAHGPTERAH